MIVPTESPSDSKSGTVSSGGHEVAKCKSCTCEVWNGTVAKRNGRSGRDGGFTMFYMVKSEVDEEDKNVQA